MAQPLLIGGATTSKQHTAVRIAPEYSQPTLHVLDASRVVGVVSDLLDSERRTRLDTENRELQERLREQHEERTRKPLLPLEEARARRHRVSFADLPGPAFTGGRMIRPGPAQLGGYVERGFFFPSLGRQGRCPAL